MGYRASEIAAKSGLTTRTINNWIRRGVLPKVTFRGANTTYTDEHLVGLQAIRALLAQRRGISGVRSFFKTATPDDIRRVAGVDAPPTSSAANATSSAASNVARWTHVTLAPGVMLLVRDDATDSATKIAAVFKTAFGAAT